MSLPQIDFLKPENSLELKRQSRLPENFTTTAIRHFCSMEFGGYGVAAKVVNNDSTNTLSVILHNPGNTARIIPVNSELIITEWFDIIIITPDGTTGSGQLELDIVLFPDTRAKNG